jgi:hypothetical protein
VWRVALSAFVAVIALSLPASDNWTGYAGGCNLGTSPCTNWTVASGGSAAWAVNFAATRAIPNAGGAVHDVVIWTADSFAADQYSETTVALTGGPDYVGPAARFDSSGNGYGFICGTSTLYKYTATAAATLQTGYTACTDGDVVRMTVTGTSTTSIDITLNGVSAGSTYNDSTLPWTSGAAGMDGYATAGASVSLWTGNNTGGGGPTFPAAIINRLIRCCQPHSARFGR